VAAFGHDLENVQRNVVRAQTPELEKVLRKGGFIETLGTI